MGRQGERAHPEYGVRGIHIRRVTMLFRVGMCRPRNLLIARRKLKGMMQALLQQEAFRARPSEGWIRGRHVEEAPGCLGAGEPSGPEARRSYGSARGPAGAWHDGDQAGALVTLRLIGPEGSGMDSTRQDL